MPRPAGVPCGRQGRRFAGARFQCRPRAEELPAYFHRHARAERAAARRGGVVMSGARVLFIDRDGTLVEEPPDQQVDTVQKIRLLPGVIPALLDLKRAGYRFVLVSNQDGLGTASFPVVAFEEPQNFLRRLLASQGIAFDAE